MKKKEIKQAFIDFDIDKIYSFLFTDNEEYLHFPNFTHPDMTKRIWIGQYLYHLYLQKKIPADTLIKIIQLKDRHGRNWFHYLAKQAQPVAEAAINLLKAIIGRNLLTADDILALLFDHHCQEGSFIFTIATKHPELFGSLIIWLDSLVCRYDHGHTFQGMITHFLNANLAEESLSHLILTYCPKNFAFIANLLLSFLDKKIISIETLFEIITRKNANSKNIIDLIIMNDDHQNIMIITTILAKVIAAEHSYITHILNQLNRRHDDVSNFDRIITRVDQHLAQCKNDPFEISDLNQSGYCEYINNYDTILKLLCKSMNAHEEYYAHFVTVLLPPIMEKTACDGSSMSTSYHHLESRVFSLAIKNIKKLNCTEPELFESLFLTQTAIIRLAKGIAKLRENVVEFIFKIMLALFQNNERLENHLFTFLKTTFNNFGVFQSFAYYRDEDNSLLLLNLTFPLIERLRRILTAKLYNDNDANKAKFQLTQLEQWQINLLTSIEKKPCYLQLLISKKYFTALRQYLENNVFLIFSSRELLKQIMLALADPLIIQHIFPPNRAWYIMYVERLILRIYSSSIQIDKEELACIVEFAKTNNAAANYVLSRILPKDSMPTPVSYFSKSYECNYEMALIEDALITRTKDCRLYRRLSLFDDLHNVLMEYRNLKLLSDHDYLFLLENSPFSNNPHCKFYVAKFYYDQQNLEYANKTFKEIGDLSTLTADQNAELANIHCHLFIHFDDYSNLYLCIRSIHLALLQKFNFSNLLPHIYEHYLDQFPFFKEFLNWEQETNDRLKSALSAIKNEILLILRNNDGQVPLSLMELCTHLTQHNDTAIERYIDLANRNTNSFFSNSLNKTLVVFLTNLEGSDYSEQKSRNLTY